MMFNKRTYIIILIIIVGLSLIYFTYTSTDIQCIDNKPTCVIEEDPAKNYNIDNFNNTRDNVFFDIAVGIKKVGRIEIELFDEDVPITCKNFRYLCSQDNQKLNYVDSIFHRVLSGHLIQGGDIINYDGTGGYSGYGPYFKDENFILKHNQEGLLAMANCGKDKNNSQFFITTRRGGYEDLNDKYVVFGIIVKGYEIVKKIEESKINRDYKPKNECRIIDCGLIKRDETAIIDDTEVSEETIKLSI
jgi:cyclophilin family peptidyl-prolyl cis-trans isomerase